MPGRGQSYLKFETEAYQRTFDKFRAVNTNDALTLCDYNEMNITYPLPVQIKASDRTGGRSPPTSVSQSDVTVNLWNTDYNPYLVNDFDSQFLSTTNPEAKLEKYSDFFVPFNKKAIEDVFGESAYVQVQLGYQLVKPLYLVENFFAKNVFLRNNLVIKDYKYLMQHFYDYMPLKLREFVSGVTLYSVEGREFREAMNET